MAALAREGAADARIRSLVRRFGRVHLYQLPLVMDAYIRSTFSYSDEVIETLKAPERILDEIEAFGGFTGDCDDVSIWTATLATAMGYPVRFVAIRTDPRSEDFSHVFTDVNFSTPTGNAWVRFDATVPRATEHAFVEAMVEYVW